MLILGTFIISAGGEAQPAGRAGPGGKCPERAGRGGAPREPANPDGTWMKLPRDTGALRALQLVLGYNAAGARRAGQQPRGPCHLSSRKRPLAPGGASGPQVARGTRAERRGRWHDWHQDRRHAGPRSRVLRRNMNLTLHVRDCN